MKIVLLHDQFPPEGFGGAAHSTALIAEGLLREGHDVSVITTCRKRSDAGESEYRGIKTWSIYSHYPDRWRAYLSLYNPPVVREVKKLLAELRPDVVHIQNVHQYLSYHCFTLAKRYAKVVVFTARDVMTFNYGKLLTPRYLERFEYRTYWFDHVRQAGKRYNPLRNLLIRRYVQLADKVFAISGALQDALRRNNIPCGGVIYNGIDADVWQAAPGSAEAFRKKHGIVGKKVILFGGRLSPAKGAEKAIEALALMREEPNVVLLIAGKTDGYVDLMRQKAEGLGVADRLVFAGWLGGEDIKAAYAAADLVWMLSICFDSFGRVNIEAMSAGKPVIGTCYGGTPEVVIDGVTGYIINPLYPERIAEKTLSLLRHPEKARQFGAAGNERVRATFAISTIIAQTLASYRDALDTKNT